VLHVGSDGQTFDVLFPNQFDANNRMSEGTLRLPSDKWRVKVGGPEGTSHLLAVVSPSPKNITKGMNMRSAFPNTPTTAGSASSLNKNLDPEGTDGNTYGASNILSLEEQR